MWWLFSSILLTVLLLAVRALEDFEYISQSCIDVADCNECMNSINNGWLDTSKCIPVLPSLHFNEEGSFYVKAITCASLETVESKKYKINYKCNNDLIPEETKAQISNLRYNVKWAYYPYYVTPTDTLLSDMAIIDSSLGTNRAVVGYERTNSYIIISFRGTSNIMNFIDDFYFPVTSYNKPGCNSCYVHSGFLSSYNSLSGEVLDHLSQLLIKYPEATILVTGHSLGGTQAVLAALDIKLAGYTPHLYTYGCPRVGNKNFASFFNSKITEANFRAVYLDDPVPNVPTISLTFYHVGTEIHFYDCNQYLAYPKLGDQGESVYLLSIGDHSKYECIYPQSGDTTSIIVI
jgi:hypothetical protein